jgi:DNA polymerase III, epsilon subunit and related 3''-5'' exonucleases
VAPSAWAVVDVETTGLHPVRDRIVEVAVIRLGPDAELIDEWSTLVNPGERALGGRIHGLRAADLADAPSFQDILGDLLARLAGNVIVAHNAPFDVSFLQAETVRSGVAWGPVEGLCTMELLRVLGLSKSRKLHLCCAELDIWAGQEHIALEDARAVAGIMSYLAPRLWAIDAPGPAPVWPAPTDPAKIKTRTIQSGAAPIAELGRHFRIPSDLGVTEAAATTYLGLLDQVVEDGRVTDTEIEALALFAHACGISRDAARHLHLAYLDEMERVARADGIVTAKEQEHLDGLIPLLSAALPR